LHSAADRINQWPRDDLTEENLAEEIPDSEYDLDTDNEEG